MNDYDDEEPTTTEMVLGVIQQGLQYSFVEVIFLVMFTLGRVTGDGIISPVILWVSLVCAALWVLITSAEDAIADCKQYVLDRELFMSDFLMSAGLLTVSAIVVWPYAWYFPAMLLIAVAQNLRYTHMSMKWLIEERRGQSNSNDDNMS